MKRINVTRSFLPPINEYVSYVEKIWENRHLTNQGPLLKKFEVKLKKYLNIEYLHFVTNGTLALQLAINSLGITEGEIITTPFSYVATTSAILWERCSPVFVDILPDTFCIDPEKIEAAITKETKAILAVHVFGIPCEVDKIEQIARKHHIKVIYDGAHAFGVMYKGKSLLSYGDVSICSFHATKLFHTIEGGCIITNDKDIDKKIDLIKRFGHHGDEHYILGINAKASEFQAAMGLCNLKYISKIIKGRKKVSDWYDNMLKGDFQRLCIPSDTEYNYSYYPVIFNDERQNLNVIKSLNKANIYPRRYFYPSLNELPYVPKLNKYLLSQNISRKILSLPMHEDLDKETVHKICHLISVSHNQM